MVKKTTVVLFLLTVFSLPFVNIFYLTIFEQKVLITELLFLLTALFFISSVLKTEMKFEIRTFYFPLILYLIALALSVVFSTDLKTSSIKFVGVTYLVGLAVLAFNLIKDFKIAKWVCFVWLVGSFLSAFAAIVTIFLFYFDRSNLIFNYTLFHYGTLPVGNYPRIQSTFLNANMYCHFLSISWLLLFTSHKMNWIGNYVLWVLIAFFSIASAFTISPSLGGIGLGLGLWFWISLKGRNKRVLATGTLVIGICFAVMFLIATVVTVQIPKDTTSIPNAIDKLKFGSSVRVRTWKAAADTLFENPIFGRGLGTESVEVRYLSLQGIRQRLTDAHQLFLNIAAQSGIIGLLAVLFLGFWLLRNALPFEMKKEKDVLRTGLGIAFFSSFFYQGLSGSFEDARHLWVLIGFLGAVSQDGFPTAPVNPTSSETELSH